MLHEIVESLGLHSVRRSPFLTILSRKLDDDDDVMLSFYSRKSDCIKVIHPKDYKYLKNGAHQSHLGRQKMGWFPAD